MTSFIKVGVGYASQSIQRVQNSHVVKLVGVINLLEIVQSDWSWWNSNNRTKQWIGLIPDLLPGNVVKLVGVINPLEILQSDWSWWNSNNRTKLWIGLIPNLLPGNGARLDVLHVGDVLN